MPQMNDSNKDLKEIDDMLNNMPNTINPGFVDVDSIEKNAQDIYVEKPLADIDNLLMSQNSNNELTNDFSSMENETNQETNDQLQQNKFFTMVAPEDTVEENGENSDSSDSETFNFTPTIETNDSLNQFLEPTPTETNISNNQENSEVIEQNKDTLTPFNFNYEEPVENNIFESQKIEENQSNMYEVQDEMEEIDDVPKTINYPADNNLAESIKKEEVVEVQSTNNTNETQVDLKTVINTIRNCSDTIEKFGFAIECEEYDFEDMYQVIFKIQKKD